MNLNKFFQPLLLILITLGACADKNDHLISTSNELESKDITSRVYSLGFDTIGIKHFGDTIIVEEDIALRKSLLNQVQPRQASINQITGYNKNHIRVHVPQSIISDRNLILSALQEFSSIRNPGSSTNITFELTGTVSNKDLQIRYTTLDYGLCGYAWWPTVSNSKMNIGAEIVLNSREWRNLNASQKRFLIIHEFGHCIGLRHTNWIDRGEGFDVGAYTIPGTPDYSGNPDPLSVFNAATCGYSWSGFSQYDIVAINYLQGN